MNSVDQKRSTFALRVGDHTRTVQVTPQTDLGAYADRAGRVPVRVGERVNVDGVFGKAGTVTAETVAPALPPAPANAPAPDSTLSGPVVGESDRLRSRDIKVRGADGRDVTVHVPRGIPILRDGRPISVHDLGKQDVVRVDGAADADGSFRASAITVTGDVRDGAGG